MIKHEAQFGNQTKIGGFTIIEMMVAVTVLAIVVTVVFSTWTASVTAWKRTTSMSDTLQRQRIVTETLSELVKSAIFFGSKPELYRVIGEHEEPSRDSVSFVTSSRVLLPPSEMAIAGMRRVRISLERGDEGKSFLAIANAAAVAEEDEISNVKPRVLSADVIGFRVRYRHPDSGEWQDEWEEEDLIPAAVEFSVAFDPEEEDASPVSITRAVDLPTAEYALQTQGRILNINNTTNTVSRQNINLDDDANGSSGMDRQ